MLLPALAEALQQQEPGTRKLDTGTSAYAIVLAVASDNAVSAMPVAYQ
jgi:hypothetical protein